MYSPMSMVGDFEVLVGATICIFILCYWIKNSSSPPITDWPVVGMLPGLLHNNWRIHQYSTEILIQRKGIAEFKGGWFPRAGFVITSDPTNVNHILSKNFANYQKGSDFQEVLEPLGNGIFRSDGDVWKGQRKSMLSAMHNKRFELLLRKCTWQKVEKGLIPILDHVAKWRLEMDLQDLFQRLTFDVIGLLVFGSDSNSLSIELPTIPHEKAFDDMEKAVFSRYIKPKAYWKLLKWLQVGEEKTLKEAWEIFDRFLYQNISAAREKASRSMSKMEEEEFNLVQAFLADDEGVQSDSPDNSNNILRDHAFNLMAAGRDTVSAGLTWFFWFVATNPYVETKILEEIKEKLVEKDGLEFSNAEELNALVYLHATLCETLRLYPPIPFNHKTAIEADVLPTGHSISQNAKVLISFYAMGRMQEIWGEDCLEFKPERWITKHGGIMHVPSYKFPAFNAGPRSCLGKDMSFVQMKIIAVAMIWKYHVQLVEGHPVSPKHSVILHMKYGLKVKIVERFD